MVEPRNDQKDDDDDKPTILILHTTLGTNPNQLREKLQLKEGEDKVNVEKSEYKIVTNYYTAETKLKIVQLPVLNELILSEQQIKNVQDIFESLNVQSVIYYLEDVDVGDFIPNCISEFNLIPVCRSLSNVLV